MAGARRRLRPLREIRLSMMALILRVALAPAGPEEWTMGSMPANPLEAAAAIWPRALVARATAVAAWSACDAAASSLTLGAAGGLGRGRGLQIGHRRACGVDELAHLLLHLGGGGHRRRGLRFRGLHRARLLLG